MSDPRLHQDEAVNFPVFVNFVGAWVEFFGNFNMVELVHWKKIFKFVSYWFNGEMKKSNIIIYIFMLPETSSRSVYNLQKSQIFKYSIIVFLCCKTAPHIPNPTRHEIHWNLILELLVQRCTGLEQLGVSVVHLSAAILSHNYSNNDWIIC